VAQGDFRFSLRILLTDLNHFITNGGVKWKKEPSS
jgi:hypothetical protein